MNIQTIPIDQLKRSPHVSLSERPLVTEKEVEMARSHGIIRPIVVKPVENSLNTEYEIIEGEREWILAQKACIHEIVCTIQFDLNHSVTKQYVLARMSHSRNKRNPILKAKEVSETLAEEVKIKKWGALTRTADKFSMTKSVCKHLLNLLTLDTRVQDLVASGELKPNKARLLYGLPSDKQYSLALKSLEGGLSFHALASMTRDIKKGGSSLSQSSSVSCSQTKTDANQSGENADHVIAKLEEELSGITGFPVTINNDENNKGMLSLHYTNLDGLESVMERLGRSLEEDW